RMDLAEVFWRQGKYGDVPPLFKDPKYPPAPRDWADTIAPDFFDVFARSSSDEVQKAFAPIREAGFNPWFLLEFSAPFAKAGRSDVAFEMLISVNRKTPGIGLLDPNLSLYRYRKAWKGDQEALTWVREIVTPATVAAVMRAAFEQRLFELLWGFDPPAEARATAEAWFLRAAAAAIDPEGAKSHRAELESHFRSAGKEPKVEYARYLLGLSDEAALFRIAADPMHRGEVAYAFGVKAVGEGRYPDASDWFRVCLEVPPAHSADSAKTILMRWVTKGKSLEVLRRERFF
ncbi:MAG: hypothetical protein ACRD3M_00915, partial [Thermoanaerobaculia bacterium]